MSGLGRECISNCASPAASSKVPSLKASCSGFAPDAAIVPFLDPWPLLARPVCFISFQHEHSNNHLLLHKNSDWPARSI